MVTTSARPALGETSWSSTS